LRGKSEEEERLKNRHPTKVGEKKKKKKKGLQSFGIRQQQPLGRNGTRSARQRTKWNDTFAKNQNIKRGTKI